jgi:hypothetical protein
MNVWRLALPTTATVLAGVVWYLTPALLDAVGLGEFLFLGRLCLIVLTLGAAEIAFSRLHRAEP